MNNQVHRWCVGLLIANVCQATAQTATNGAVSTNQLSADGVISTLQAAGFQAQSQANLPNGASQILSGVGGIKVLFTLYHCAGTTQVCVISLGSAFNDVTNVSDEMLLNLNAASLPKVTRQTTSPYGISVTYVYPCEGFNDSNFIPMLLKTFGTGVLAVVNKSKELGLIGTASKTTATGVVQQETHLWEDKPQYAALASSTHVQNTRIKKSVEAEYPRELRAQRLEATVKVSFVIDVKGEVEDARVLDSTDARFNSAALTAVRKSSFFPAPGAAGAEREMWVTDVSFKAP